MEIKTILNSKYYLEIKERINNINPNNKVLCGKMGVLEIIKHNYLTLGIGLGTTKINKSNFLLRIFGIWFRKNFTKDNKIFAKNSPTDKSLIIKKVENINNNEFNAEKQKLIETFDEYYNKLIENKILSYHPFFQNTNQTEWGILTYKHLDHHLRQLGL